MNNPSIWNWMNLILIVFLGIYIKVLDNKIKSLKNKRVTKS